MTFRRYLQKLITLIIVTQLLNTHLLGTVDIIYSIPYQIQKQDGHSLETIIAANTNQTAFTISQKMLFDDRLGPMNDIVIQNNMAFVAVSWGGLVIFDITDLSNPTFLGSYYEPLNTTSASDSELTSGVFVRDEIAFVADGANGLLIINISNPNTPFKIGHYKDGELYQNVFVKNNYAYLIHGSDTLVILNVTNLSSPEFLSENRYKGSQFNDISAKNDFVFLWGYSGSFMINISNAINPIVMFTLNSTTACAIQDSYLLTAKKPNRLVIYNLSSPVALSVIANYSVPIMGEVKYLCSNDEFAYIGSNEEIVVVNIEEITNPVEYSKITSLKWLPDSAIVWIKRKLVTFNEQNKKDILLFTDYQQGLFIHNITKPVESSLIGHYDCGMRVERVEVKGNYVYVSSRPELPYFPARFEIYSYTDNTMHKVGIYTTNSSISDFIVIDGFAFLASSSGVEVVDLSNPTSPINIGVYEYTVNPFPCWNLFYEEERALLYLCCDSDGLVIVDVSNVHLLKFVSQIETIAGYPFRAYDVFVTQGNAYVTDCDVFGGFGIINVTDPWTPNALSYKPLNEAILGIQVQDQLAYLTARYPLLQIFNITDSANPEKVSELDTANGDSTGNFFIENGFYFAPLRHNLTIVDIRNATNPSEIFYIEHSPSAFYMDAFIEDSLLYLACAWGGLEIWQLPTTNQPNIVLMIILYTIVFCLGSSIIAITILTLNKKKQRKGTIKRLD